MTVTVVPTVEDTNTPPRVRLDVTADAGETVTTITRLDPDGRTREVRTTDGNPLPLSGGAGLVYDYEAPFGAPVTYSTLESSTVLSTEVTVDVGEVWLIHPGVPEISMPIELRAGSFDEEEWPVEQAVFYPMGREFPVVQTDGARKAPRSSMTVAVSSLQDLWSLRAVLSDGNALFLNVPQSLGLGVESCYIAPGAVRNARPSSIGSDPYRDVTIPFTVVDRPAGGSQAERTLADLLVYPTLAAVQAAYATLADVLAGP